MSEHSKYEPVSFYEHQLLHVFKETKKEGGKRCLS